MFIFNTKQCSLNIIIIYATIQKIHYKRISDSPFTILASCVVTTIQTAPTVIFARVRPPIALTRLTCWKTKEATLTLVTLTPVDIGPAQTLTTRHITELVLRPRQIAVASCKKLNTS